MIPALAAADESTSDAISVKSSDSSKTQGPDIAFKDTQGRSDAQGGVGFLRAICIEEPSPRHQSVDLLVGSELPLRTALALL